MRILVALVLVALQQGREKPAPDVKEEKYGTHARNILDLWKAKSESPTPFLIFIHGGGFRAGSKEQLPPNLLKLCLEKGISVASINYRLTDTAPFPAPMHDGALALQYLRHKAKEFNLDPGRVACSGGSAGAGISLWLAFHEDLADAKSEDPVKRQSTRITCAFVTQGQSSYDPRFIKEHIGGKAHEHPALMPFWGIKADEMESEKADKIFKECSPITHLTKDDPPVYLWYSGKDQPSEKPGAGIHHEKFGEILQLKMAELKIDCELKIGRDSDAAQVEWVAKKLKK